MGVVWRGRCFNCKGEGAVHGYTYLTDFELFKFNPGDASLASGCKEAGLAWDGPAGIIPLLGDRLPVPAIVCGIIAAGFSNRDIEFDVGR